MMKYAKVLLLGSALVLAGNCSQGDLGFQVMEPASDVALSNLFNETPAIKASFSGISSSEFNRRMETLLLADPVTGVKMLKAIATLSREKPALPKLMDALSATVDQFARYYQSTPERNAEYNSAIDVGTKVLDIDPKAMTDGSMLIAKTILYAGNDPDLFPSSTTVPPPSTPNMYKFPDITVWKTCDDQGDIFQSGKPPYNASEEGRDALFSMYDILRLGYCIYADKSYPRVTFGTPGTGATAEATVKEGKITEIVVTNGGSGYVTAPAVYIDAEPGPGSGATATAVTDGDKVISITVSDAGSGYEPKNDDTPGAFMRNTISTLKGSGNIELRVLNLINDLENKIADYEQMERNIVDWTVKVPEKVAVTDYLTNELYSVTRKDFVFDLGKPLLDAWAEHLSMKNPENVDANDKYLTQWLFKSLRADAPKLDDLENFSTLDTTSPMYVFGKDMVENGSYGLNQVLTRYNKSSMRNVLWGPKFYQANACDGGMNPPCGGSELPVPPQQFKGLLFSDGTSSYLSDGYITRLAQVPSTQTFYNSYRQLMATNLTGLVSVPATYNGEVLLESVLKNIYYHVLDRFYHKAQKKWALDAQDANDLFGDPERNLLGYLGGLQYASRNMMILDKTGKAPGEPGFDNVPYLTSFLYTLAASNGYADPFNAPAELTLRKSLQSMGASDIATDGIRTLSLPLGIQMNILVTNNPEVNYNGNVIASGYRNGEKYSTSLSMFDFELISPGRFVPRTGSTEVYAADPVSKWRGNFSAHQGDVETSNQKTSNWVIGEMALSSWEGYGPYSVKGKAPNGSNVKYDNDYYTDGYRSRLATDATGMAGIFEYHETAMGSNLGNGGSPVAGNGNYHVYERIYRPKNPGDPCYNDSQANVLGYPKYGYLRPHNSATYTNDSACTGWSKIRLDYDTREEAIRANLEWLLKYKKYVFVIPMTGEATMWTIFNNGAGFAVYSTINANGVYGVTNAKRACNVKTCNGQWGSGVSMGADGDGYVPFSVNGFVLETPTGSNISRSVRYGVTSYSPGDSMVLLDTSIQAWGLTNLLTDVSQQLWDSLGDGPVTPAMVGDNFDSVLALADALYKDSDLMATVSDAQTDSISKFRKFYDTFFTTDEFNATGGAGSNGQPDLWEKYLQSITYSDCMNGGVPVSYCLRARDLPPIPKVNPNSTTCSEFATTGCIRYPRTYNTNGTVATWYNYTGPSEGKFTAMLLPLITLMGTMHEDGNIRKSDGNLLSAGQNRDNVTIRNFEASGYRQEVVTLLEMFAALNESERGNTFNTPVYDTTALSNILSESAAGLRNGFLARMVTNKYANVSYLDPLKNDIEKLVRDNIKRITNNFELTRDDNAGTIRNKDRLRYFATYNVFTDTADPFGTALETNKLNGVTVNGTPLGGEPMRLLKEFFKYLRTLSNDAEIVNAIKKGVVALNNYLTIQGVNTQINLTDHDIDQIVQFMKDTNSNNENTVEAFIEMVISTKLNDIDTLREFTFDKFKTLGSYQTIIDDMNDKIYKYFEKDYKKDVVMSALILGEPTCPGGPTAGYYDRNGDGKWQSGTFLFISGTGTGQFYSDVADRQQTGTGTDTPGSFCTVSTEVPNIYEPHYYLLDFAGVAKNASRTLSALTQPDIDDSLNWLYGSGSGLVFDDEMRDLKNDILGTIYEKRVAEPHVDRNNNGIIEDGEYTDINGNNQYDNGVFTDTNHNNVRDGLETDAPACASYVYPTGLPVTWFTDNSMCVRKFIKYYMEDVIMPKYDEMYSKGYLRAGSRALEELLSPTKCGDDGITACSANADYKSQELLTVRKKFYDSTNFTPEQLKSVKNVVGNFLYNKDTDEYTFLLTKSAPELATVLRQFQGDYEDLLNVGLEGYKPNGFLTYFSTNLKNNPPYTSLDILSDVRTMFNTRAMRCYPGITREYVDKKEYCLAYTANDTFWGQLGLLLDQFSEAAYIKYKDKWRSEMEPEYFEKLSKIFE